VTDEVHRYPVHSLGALTLLKQPRFRMDIANPGLAQEMVQDMIQSFLPKAQTPPAAGKENGAATTNGTGSGANTQSSTST
jgi:hypothetical protein